MSLSLVYLKVEKVLCDDVILILFVTSKVRFGNLRLDVNTQQNFFT